MTGGENLYSAQVCRAFQQCLKIPGKAGGWRAIHDIVVETERQAQVLADGDLAFMDARFLRQPAHRHAQRVVRQEDDPPSGASEP